MHVISLDKNENHYPQSPQVLSYLGKISPDVLSTYGPSLDPLILELSRLYHVPFESIFLANGGEDILKSAVAQIVEEGDCVLVPEGGWAYYRELVEQASGKTEYFPVEKDENHYFYPLEAIRDSITKHKPKLIIIASPNNPTGHILPPQDLLKLLEISKTLGIYVILDEAYVGFGAPSLSYENIQEEYPYLLVVRTFSKFFGLAGLRIGFCFWGKKWEGLGKRHSRYLGFSHLSSDIALRALDSVAHYQENADIIVKERDAMTEFFRSYGLNAYTSWANFLFCFLPPNIFNVSSKILPERGIKIKFFSALKEPWFEGGIRISIGLESENQKVKEAFLEVFKSTGISSC